MIGIANVNSNLSLGNGAQFWAYLSPENGTAKKLVAWTIRITHSDSDWTGIITSGHPQVLQTPHLSGQFKLTVTACLNPLTPLETVLKPLPEVQAGIGCNSNCAAMIGIVISPDGKRANYWTVSDAMCKMPQMAA
jgi:hypothetical protein